MQPELNDFTPFGYLRNPAHLARAWGETRGGNLRTSEDRLGLEWAYPVGRDANACAGVALETTVDGRDCRRRPDFDAIGLVCRHHSCDLIAYEWHVDGVHVDARFFLVDDDALCARVTATNVCALPRVVDLRLVAHSQGQLADRHTLIGESSLAVTLAPGATQSVAAVLARDADPDAAADPVLTRGADTDAAADIVLARDADPVLGHRAERDPEVVLASVEPAYARVVAQDAAFAANCPTLAGDWPPHWAEGLHHDFQTTRLLVQPPGGIFTDVWPAWMAAWPRVVFAEGTLDMLRLAYADPSLAQRAVATLLRDAPAANVPCVFKHGEHNMVAADGSRCGTSPAWCLPFLNLQLLYLRTLDRDWLAQIYPRAAAFVDWWLAERTDSSGWLVYKCTWESGEDGNPRLDPTGSGDADISTRVRPVELQATLAHAAGVLGFFASELGLDASRWRALEAEYRERTRQLFDPSHGRYVDWLIAEHRFQAPSPDQPYWGVDACRFSPQSLTPLLVGLPLDADEVWRHATPPWTLWPSWTWSLVESAAAAGLYAGVGELCFDIIDRVYRVTTRRELGSLRRPMPGSSPEFWPEDWRTYGGSDAYGWGATTANLLIRHLFGFKESLDTDGVVFDLTPALPQSLLREGAVYALHGLPYRSHRLDITYTVIEEALQVDIADARSHRTLTTAPAQRLTVRLGH